jgi:hypothetical protein
MTNIMFTGVDSWTKHLCSVVVKQINERVEEVVGFIDAFLDLPQHVSASHCYHQAVVVTSETTQPISIVDVCGLRPSTLVSCRGMFYKEMFTIATFSQFFHIHYPNIRHKDNNSIIRSQSKTLNSTKLRGLSPRANYTDRAAAAGRRI